MNGRDELSTPREEYVEISKTVSPLPADFDDLVLTSRDRLKRIVSLRLNRQVQQRMDPSDVVQEAMLEASQRYAAYVQNPQMPIFLWLRFLALQKLLQMERFHRDVKARDVRREVMEASWATDSVAIAEKLVGQLTSPSQKAVQNEMRVILLDELEKMELIDREILTLRHFEQLSNSETATVLNITPVAACNRYIRALERLKNRLANKNGDSYWIKA